MKNRLGKFLSVFIIFVMVIGTTNIFATPSGRPSDGRSDYTLRAQTNGNPKGDVTIERSGHNGYVLEAGPGDNISASVSSGRTAKYTAIPASGYTFVKWTNNQGPNEIHTESFTIAVTRDIKYTAHFEKSVIPPIQEITITGLSSPLGAATIVATPDDLVGLSNITTVVSGTTVTLTATSMPLYSFSGWTGPNGPIVSGTTLVINNPTVDATYTANYILIPLPIVISVDGVPANPLHGDVDGPYFLPMYQAQVLTATPENGYEVDYWADELGNNLQTGGLTYNVPGGLLNRTLTVHFKEVLYTVDGEVSGGNGSVDGPFSGVAGTPATFIASPDAHYEVDVWKDETGAVVQIGGNTFGLSLSEDTTYTLVFKPILYTVTGQVSGGNGTVNDPLSGVFASSLTLTATPDTHYEVDQWFDPSGAVVQTGGNTLDVTVTGDEEYTVTFKAKQYTVTAVSDDLAMGTAGPASTVVTYPGSVTIVATPETGYKFSHWTKNGDEFTGNTEEELTVYPEANEDYVAFFTTEDMFHITLVPDENGGLGGNETVITLDPTTGITDGLNNFTIGSVLTFTYAVGPEYEFLDWLDIPSNTITVSEAADYIGDFEIVYYQVSISSNPSGAGFTSVSEASVIKSHDVVVIATPNAGYYLAEIIDAETGESVSFSNTFSFVPTKDTDLIAVFRERTKEAEEPEIPEGPGTQEPEEPDEPVEDELEIPEALPNLSEEVFDDTTPQDLPAMPQTSGIPVSLLLVGGSMLTGLGIKFRKRH